jgi:hypothetical protein
MSPGCQNGSFTYSALADSESAQDTYTGLGNAHPRLKLERQLLGSEVGNRL